MKIDKIICGDEYELINSLYNGDKNKMIYEFIPDEYKGYEFINISFTPKDDMYELNAIINDDKLITEASNNYANRTIKGYRKWEQKDKIKNDAFKSGALFYKKLIEN